MEPSDSIQQAAPVRSAERQALADAITRRGASERAVAEAEQRRERATNAVEQAEAKLQGAQERVAATREERALALAEGAETDVPAGGMREARAAESDAQDAVDAARAALDKIKARLPDLEDEARAAGNFVIVCVDTLIRSHAERALAEAEDLLARLRRTRPLLRFMCDPELRPESNTMWRKPVFNDEWDMTARQHGKERASRRQHDDMQALRMRDEGFVETAAAIKRFIEAQPFHEDGWHRDPVLGPWQQARAAMLAGDLDTPLPEL